MGVRPIDRLIVGQQIRLRDGRCLGFTEFGDPSGPPVMEFHGGPGSRLPVGHGQHLPFRWITIDRPDMGLSDFQPGRSLLDWPDDVRELADALELNTFAVAGISSGAAYVLECAFAIPDRLTGPGIVSGVSPPTKLRWQRLFAPVPEDRATSSRPEFRRD